MSELLFLILGSFIGLSIDVEVTASTYETAVQKCSTNGGVKHVTTGSLSHTVAICKNGARFKLHTQ